MPRRRSVPQAARAAASVRMSRIMRSSGGIQLLVRHGVAQPDPAVVAERGAGHQGHALPLHQLLAECRPVTRTPAAMPSTRKKK